MNLPRAIIAYLAFTVFVAGLCLLLPVIFPSEVLYAGKFWVIFGFVAGITLIAMVVALFGIKHKPETGVMAIMGSIIIKMLFSMGFVLAYALKTPVNSMLFIFNFFSLYFLFSGFELYCLLRNLRHPIKK